MSILEREREREREYVHPVDTSGHEVVPPAHPATIASKSKGVVQFAASHASPALEPRSLGVTSSIVKRYVPTVIKYKIKRHIAATEKIGYNINVGIRANALLVS